jgi:hypothetical protein
VSRGGRGRSDPGAGHHADAGGRGH